MISERDLINLGSSNRDVVNESFLKIYNEYRLLVYYVSFEVTKNRADSEDILNETFLKFFENRFTIKKVKSIKYYLVTTSKNLSLNLVMKNSRQMDIEDIESIASESPKLDESEAYIAKFKEILSDEELDVVIYHLIYDFSFREIGEMKNVTVDVISGRYRRALEKLKSKYKRR